MKKFYNIFLLILVLCHPLMVKPQAQIQHNFSYSPDSLSFNTISLDTLFFTKVHYTSEHNRTCDTGNPELPVMYYNFIIPIDKKANHVTITNKVFGNYNVSFPIYPVQKPIPLCMDCEAPGFCFPNVQVYKSSNVFPSNYVITLNYGFFDRNCHILTIGICPFEYYPSLGQIKMLTSFDVTINLVPDSNPRTIIPIKRLSQSQALYDQILFRLVENTDQISGFYHGSTIVEELGYTPSGLPAYEYVIITPNRFVSAFNDFVVWKKQKGVDIGFVTIEDVSSHYVGDVLFPNDAIYDKAGKLRQYLSEAHEQGTVYALLAGDYPDIPIRYGWTEDNTANNEYIIPADLYFSDFSGNWNVDHDTRYGEFSNDAPDFTPEIYVGRLLCSSDQDITNWVNKTILYEKTPGNGNASYLTQSFMTEADECQFQEEAEEVATHLTMFNHTIWKESPGFNSTPPVFPKGSDIIQELNTHHYGLMSCFNHGGTGNGESGFATMMNSTGLNPQWKLQAQELHPYSGAMPDNNNGLDNLTNYNYPFVIYTVSCWICPFDRTSSNNNNGARNTGESFTVDNLAGGVAFFGNNRRGFVGSSKDLYLVFSDLLSEYSVNKVYPRFGLLELISKSRHSLTATAQYTTPKYSCYNHNLIGDPECSLWTCVPENLSVSILPQSASLNRNNSFQVTINNLDYNQTAVVTLYKASDIYERMEVTGNQQGTAVANFYNVNPATNGDITVTVTSFCRLPYQEDIEVSSNCEIVINNTTVWQDDDILNCNVVVNDGGVLTVKSRLQMSPDAKVIVKPGGRLILDGGTITNYSDGIMWPGIEVWGNSATHQYEINGSYGQGYLELKNGARIENAVCAVELCRPGVPGTSGGIVLADSAFFVNNAKAV